MPRTRDRHSAEGLLPRMEARPWADGKTVTYRYHPIGGKPMNLGTDKIAASLAGNRRVEFLDLSWPQIDEAAKVVRTKRAKQRGKKRGEVIELVTITPALQSLIDRLKAVRASRAVDCLYVFPTRENNAYTDRGFKTLWQRCVQDAMAEKIIEKGQRFTFHDLRAYYTTVHKQAHGQLPDLHTNPATTARVYDRTKVVKRQAL